MKNQSAAKRLNESMHALAQASNNFPTCRDPGHDYPMQFRTFYWIDVRVAVPDDKTCVLIQFSEGGFNFGWRHKLSHTGWIACNGLDAKVTHWAELPEPAKVVKEVK